MASFATLSPCASVQVKASFSSSSSPVTRSSSSSLPLCCPFLYSSVSAAAIQYRKLTIAIKPISHRTKINCAINDSSSSRAPKETILLPGCDYEHWLIVMEFPKDPKPSSEEMIDTYIKTLAKVVGSEEEAKKKIYALSTTTYTGFQANISEELSEKCKGLPGVLWVLPDSYIDVPNKDYGGDKFVDGKVIPRPQPTPSERQTRSRYNRTNRTRYERRRDGPPRSSPVQVQQRNNPGSEQTELVQSEGQ